jgi:protein YIPF5/7
MAHSVLFDQQQQPLFASAPASSGSNSDGLQFLSSNTSTYLSSSTYGGQMGNAGTGTSYVDPLNRVFVGSPFGTGGYADEPPLLEELGINMRHIWNKSVSVLNVVKRPDSHIMDDTDIAGPIFFCTMFGAFLLLVNSALWYVADYLEW